MMKSTLALCVAGVAAVCIVLLGSVGCEEGGAKISAAATAAPSASPIAAPLPKGRPSDATMDALMKNFKWDEFEQMIYVLGLASRTPEPIDANKPPKMIAAEKAFRANMAARAAKLDKHRASAEYKALTAAKEQLAEARKGGDEKKIAAAQKAYDALAAKDRAYMEDLRRVVMGPMTADQRMCWAQYVCYRDISGRLRAADLTDAQKDKLWTMCAGPAKELVAADYVATDPYLTGEKTHAVVAQALSQAYKSVLTAEQQKAVPEPGTTAKPVKAARPAKAAKK